MTKTEAAITLAVLIAIIWPAVSTAFTDDGRDGFWVTYRAHAIGWAAIIAVISFIFAVVYMLFYSLSVLMS